MDIRLKTAEYDYGGKRYILCCNMNVLADVEEEFGGSFFAAVNGKGNFRATLAFLAAMLNDYADTMGWPERVSRKELGRKISLNEVTGELMEKIWPLVMDALRDPEEDEENEKN